MEEKKKFILAIPTIIIIFVVIIGMFLIFYNRNVKELSREDAKLLSQKAVNIDNISCEIVTESNEENINTSNIVYKLKDNKLMIKTNYYTIYDDQNTKSKIQIDESEKVAYIYSEYQSEITSFKEMLCMPSQLLDSQDYEYEFLNYETMNGVKCASFSVYDEDSTFYIWIDKSNGMVVKIECQYHSEGMSDITTTMYYRYQLNNVKDEEMNTPDLSDYTTVEL